MKLFSPANFFSPCVHSQRIQRFALAITWIVIQFFLLWKNGIVTSLEAVKYIDQAKLILSNGAYSSTNFLFYSVQILLIALCLKFKISYLFLVIFQIIFNGISIICFYKLVLKLSNSIMLSFMSTGYFLIFIYYQIFNTYLFTESLFFSFSVIYTWFLFTREKINIKNIILILLSLSLLYLTRPTGIFFIPATFLFLIIKFYSKNAFTIMAISLMIAFIAFYFLLNFSLGSGGEFNFLLPYNNEIVICGVPTITQAHNITIPVEQNSVSGLWYVITHNFNLFLGLSIRRLYTFFSIYRPYYSAFHNIFAMAYFFCMYLIVILGLKNLCRRYKAEVWYLISNIMLMAITVMLSCDEWSNRFILAVLPFILLLSVLSIINYKARIDGEK